MRAIMLIGLAAVFVVGLPAGAHVARGWRPASDSGQMSAAQLCPPPSDMAALRSAGQRAPVAGVTARLGSIIDAGGVQTGRLASFSLRGASRSEVLASESFVSPAMGNVVVYGQHVAGNGSQVRALDLASGCEWVLPSPGGVARSAVIDGEMAALYVHTVAEATRADRGITRIELASGRSERVLPPLAAATDYGTTYSTLLRWSIDGTELAVATCGWLGCRTRVFDPADSSIDAYLEPAHGHIVALTAQRLYAFEPCHERPCPLLALDRAGGSVTVVEPEVLSAALLTIDGRAAIVFETPAGSKEIRP